MEETGSIDWLMIALLAVIFICWLFIIIIQISETIDLRNNLRKIYPDASLSPLLHSISFRYKGFKAKLSWFDEFQERYSGRRISAKTIFCVILPNEIKKALADAGFSMEIRGLCGDDGTPQVISQNCTIKSRNAVMKSLRYHEGFLQALSNLARATLGFNLNVTLESSKLLITLPRKLPMDSMKGLVESGTALFDQVIAAAAAVNPALLSMPPIAGNFTVNPGEFLNEYSDEDVYDALDDSAPVNQNPAGAKEGWGKTNDTTDDERALPEESAMEFADKDDVLREK